jgi:hypothetical protein
MAAVGCTAVGILSILLALTSLLSQNAIEAAVFLNAASMAFGMLASTLKGS